ncbi:hypothetical protein C8T65DRAFT_738092 [Cerioporus squamosus]|nr:hypothetical protein C8T65DRAFT_738092 [Cerioporus squamosus]
MADNDGTDPDNVNFSATVRYCAQCGQEPGNGKKLKACHGCFAGPLYCSKTCQREHWPLHKLAFHGLGLTRDRDFYRILVESDVLNCGYASIETFSRAVSDFLEAHKWAFATTALSNRVVSFGTSMEDYPQDLFLQYRLFTRGGPTRNPAHGFRWENMRWKHLDEWLGELGIHYMLDEVRDALPKARRAADRHFGDDPLYIGAMPVVFTINDLPLILWHLMPQYKPRGMHPPFGSNKVACEDVAYLCTKSVNNKVVLRCPQDDKAECGGGLALPGRFVRSEGKWRWEAFDGGWGAFEGTGGVAPNPFIAEVLKADYESGLRPDEMMRALTVYRDGLQMGACVNHGGGTPAIYI